MSMGNEQASDTVFFIEQICKIRNNHIDTKLFAVRVFQTAFQDKDVIIVFNDIHVLAVFVQSAKRKNAYFTHKIIYLRIS